MKETTTPTVEDINDKYDSYIHDLDIRELHLKLIPVFPTEELDDLLSLLKEPYEIDITPKKR